MRLLTHNLMSSHVPGVKNGYPLLLKAVRTETEEVEYNPSFIVRMLPRLNWSALLSTTRALGVADDLPGDIPADPSSDDEFLRKAHHALLEVRVIEGSLECPESHRVFPIAQGVANLLLDKDE
eukprot:m.230049 g.230049  ORF g.230049 m.230049 type:complete len:123 (+) comp11998_c0_seq1:37-405(+)